MSLGVLVYLTPRSMMCVHNLNQYWGCRKLLGNPTGIKCALEFIYWWKISRSQKVYLYVDEHHQACKGNGHQYKSLELHLEQGENHCTQCFLVSSDAKLIHHTDPPIWPAAPVPFPWFLFPVLPGRTSNCGTSLQWSYRWWQRNIGNED